MKIRMPWIVLLAACAAATIDAAEAAGIPKHTVQFVTVEKDVKLEVVDWGGSESRAKSGERTAFQGMN